MDMSVHKQGTPQSAESFLLKLISQVGGYSLRISSEKNVFDTFPYVTYLLSVCTVCLDSQDLYEKKAWEDTKSVSSAVTGDI